MPVFEADTEFQSDFEALREAMKLGWPDLDATFENALRLCDNIYRRMENAASLKMAGVVSLFYTSSRLYRDTNKFYDIMVTWTIL